MSVVIIIQARMGSRRLPGKVMMPIEGQPLITHVYQRARQATSCAMTIVATGPRNANSAMVSFLESSRIPVFCGSENDVLDRYIGAARDYDATTVVRITGDCPMIDPDIIDETVSGFRSGDYDYFSNVHPPHYPDGLDVEVMTVEALERAHREAQLESEREHVTPYIWKRPQLFKLGNSTPARDLSDHRWIVDDARDLEFVRAVFQRLYLGYPRFRMGDVLALLAEHPELSALNCGTTRNEGFAVSLNRDRIMKRTEA
jgi:spore coat polysaccharide biosynthesis protein SpsF